MDLFDTTNLALERATQAVGLRQRTIAENMANVNTAGYRRRDLDFQGELKTALSEGEQSLKALTFTPQVDETAPLRGDGSNVDIDKEQSAMAQVGLEYDALIQVMKVRVQIMRMAIGPGQ